MARSRGLTTYHCGPNQRVARWLDAGGRRGEQPPAITFNDECRQNPRPISARVDPDPVRSFLDGITDGVAMDDDEAVVGLIPEEWLADPAQVRLLLPFDLHSRPDTGMDEKIISETAGIGERPQELDMGFGNRLANRGQGGVRIHAGECRSVNAVALQPLLAPKAPPVGDQRRIAVENAQQHFLVIAEQETRLDI